MSFSLLCWNQALYTLKPGKTFVRLAKKKEHLQSQNFFYKETYRLKENFKPILYHNKENGVLNRDDILKQHI
jgi:hypothetical protein